MLRIMLIWCYKAAPKSSRPGCALRVEYAELSLVGHREDNQDRVSVAIGEHAALLLVVDGMGGHAEGARAAETALKSMLESFWHTPHPIFDPLGFLHLTLGKAHDDVVALGVRSRVETRPRATCAVCLVQQAASFWAHVGDSRVYQIRTMPVRDAHARSQSRRAAAARGPDHRSRGAGPPNAQLRRVLPRRRCRAAGHDFSRRRPLDAGDVLLLCTDGLWANLKDADIGGLLSAR